MGNLLGWISANYNPQTLFWAWGAIVLSMRAIHVAERVFPAQRGQSYKSIGFNLIATVAYLALVPIANFLPGYVVIAAVQIAHGPWLPIDLPGTLAGQSGWQR